MQVFKEEFLYVTGRCGIGITSFKIESKSYVLAITDIATAVYQIHMYVYVYVYAHPCIPDLFLVLVKLHVYKQKQT